MVYPAMARSGSDRGEERARDERVWIRGFPHDTRCLACPSFTFTSATPSKIKEHLASRHHSRAVTRANTPWFADEFADTETAAPAAAQVAAQVVANDGAFDMCEPLPLSGNSPESILNTVLA